MTGFSLHPRLAADTHRVGDLPLSRVLLMNDARYPWLILVPRRPDLREIVDLPAHERALLIEEIAAASRAVRDVSGAEKLNVGAIGNLVPQLHVHVVARLDTDAAWPAPVWGHGVPVPYGAAECSACVASLAASLGFQSDRGDAKTVEPQRPPRAESGMTPTAFSRSSASLGFVHNTLDRRANRRDDAAYLASLAALPSARSLGVIGDAVVLKRVAGTEAGQGRDPWFGLDEVGRLGLTRERTFLGEDARGPVFATLIETEAETLSARHADLALFNLRQLALDGSVAPHDLGSLAEGKALLFWHANHRFCSRCGMPTVASAGGWRRECSSCGTHHFPRTDPVVIMLAIDGERCLLGRQPRFPPGMYSCLAGFLEPGETIEDAVRREIAEEAGIATGTVTYLGSQPWPFPASLMIGCVVEAASTEITVDRQELEDARWFTRDDVKAMLAGRHPEGITCPMPMAIAHHIVLAWAGA